MEGITKYVAEGKTDFVAKGRTFFYSGITRHTMANIIKDEMKFCPVSFSITLKWRGESGVVG